MITVSDDCYRCGACIAACPVPGTITNILPGKVLVNPVTCVDCRQCLPTCRFNYLTWQPNPQEEPAPVVEQVEADSGSEALLDTQAETNDQEVAAEEPVRRKRKR